MAFEQATIKVEREQEFQQLKSAIQRVFSAGAVDKFLSGLNSKGLRIRQFEQVLERKLIERADPELKKAGRRAKELYEALPLSDQSQIREFYLLRLEDVSPDLRRKFHRVYTMY